MVACTGNTGSSGFTDVWYPAREPGVIAVAGLERNGDVLWSGSITGKQTVVTAPATQLVGARPRRVLAGAGHQLRRPDGVGHRGADPLPVARRCRPPR